MHTQDTRSTATRSKCELIVSGDPLAGRSHFCTINVSARRDGIGITETGQKFAKQTGLGSLAMYGEG